MDGPKAMQDVGLYIAICKTCNKKFYRHSYKNWAYKIKVGNNSFKYYCCYSCYRAAGGDNPKELDNHRGKLKEEYTDAFHESTANPGKGKKGVRKPKTSGRVCGGAVGTDKGAVKVSKV